MKVLIATLIAAFAASTAAQQMRAATIRRSANYRSSQVGCAHGQVKAGQSPSVIVTFTGEGQRSTTSIARRSGDSISRRFRLFPGVAASLDERSVEELLDDDNVEAIEADCVVQLEDPTTLEGKPIHSFVEDSGARTIGSSRSDVPWGLDRIDTRSGRDGQYNYGPHRGVGSRIYVLDTGVRIDHSDFTTGGQRAQPGWSAECNSEDESGCGGSWVRDGVIDASTSSCNGHGTHCASTAAGYTYGVANGATVVTVQVLSCAGSGSGAGVIAGINWAVDDWQTNNPSDKCVRGASPPSPQLRSTAHLEGSAAACEPAPPHRISH